MKFEAPLSRDAEGPIAEMQLLMQLATQRSVTTAPMLFSNRVAHVFHTPMITYLLPPCTCIFVPHMKPQLLVSFPVLQKSYDCLPPGNGLLYYGRKLTHIATSLTTIVAIS